VLIDPWGRAKLAGHGAWLPTVYRRKGARIQLRGRGRGRGRKGEREGGRGGGGGMAEFGVFLLMLFLERGEVVGDEWDLEILRSSDSEGARREGS